MTVHDTRAPHADRPLDHVELGPGIGPDLDRRLIGDVDGRRVLVLGCGAGHDAVGLARRGARVIATDDDVAQLTAARALAQRHDVVAEFHQCHPAELAFIRADQIDLAVSVTALSFVADLDRVLRQVHRVVRHGGHFLISVPHAAHLCADPTDRSRTIRSWTDPTPVGDRHVHRAEDLVGPLVRANFAVDTLVEAHDGAMVPSTLLVRARRLGV
jgi:SAM-dependent methyltransferase